MPSADLTLPGLDRPVAPLGVGTWAWGDKNTWGMGGYDGSITEATIAEAWEASVDAGATFFDTAEVLSLIHISEPTRPMKASRMT